MSVFADTSALYAAIVRTEERHQESLRLLRSLVEGGRSIRTTNYVVLETAALLQHRIGLDPVRDFAERVLPLDCDPLGFRGASPERDKATGQGEQAKLESDRLR